MGGESPRREAFAMFSALHHTPDFNRRRQDAPRPARQTNIRLRRRSQRG